MTMAAILVVLVSVRFDDDVAIVRGSTGRSLVPRVVNCFIQFLANRTTYHVLFLVHAGYSACIKYST